VLLLAVVSAVLGMLYALVERDVKSLLAYSSVENIGIVLLGVGAGLVFMSKGLGGLAALAWAAALFHVLNHAIFKSLLFLGAGAAVHATHTRDIEQMGGLIKYMPYTAAFFLAGAAAISALPPLNGFVGEWLIFQALFTLPEALPGIGGKVMAGVLISLLGLTGALAAAGFVKAFGMVFLAKPRSSQAAAAQEAPSAMLVPMALLAALCAILGLMPAGALQMLKYVLADFFSKDALNLLTGEWYSLGFQAARSSGEMSPAVLVILLAAGVVAAAAAYRLYGKPRVETGETWTCGIVPTARMEYTATGFSGPIRRAFGGILRPQAAITIDNDANPYFGPRVVFRVHITHVFNEMVYRPFNRHIVNVSRFMKRIQTGSVQLYVGYIMAVTVAVLVWSTRW
jgi:hydrogenase-4 component B